MNIDTATVAMIVVLGGAGWKIMDLVIKYFFSKLTASGYITKEACDNCSRQDDDTLKKLAADIATIKGLLLVLAMGKSLEAEDLQKLMTP